MGRLINEDDVAENLMDSNWFDCDDIDVALQAVKLTDAIDPESLRPRGYWIQTKSAWEQKQLECSCCGSKWPEYARFFAYCPYCGAKMEEKTDET